MEPMDTDKAQQITDWLTQSIRNSGKLRRSGSLGDVPSPLSAAVHFPPPSTSRSATPNRSTYPKFRCSHGWQSSSSSDADGYSDSYTRGRC